MERGRERADTRAISEKRSSLSMMLKKTLLNGTAYLCTFAF